MLQHTERGRLRSRVVIGVAEAAPLTARATQVEI